MPVRFTFDNNYFNDKYQGIPIGGYNQIIEKLTEGIEIKYNVDFFENRREWDSVAERIIFTGQIDKYYDYCFGKLEYRSLRFEEEWINTENHQGCAVINYTEKEIPYTRIIEHKHFESSQAKKTIITREYPDNYETTNEPYYPINNDKNSDIYQQYYQLAQKDKKVIFGGRLGEYRYYDMDKVIESALSLEL